MRTVGKAIAAATIAVVMLVVGGIGVVTITGEDAGTTRSPAIARVLADTALRPTLGADLGSTIASLQERVRIAPEDADAFAQLGLAYVTQARVTADPSWYPKAHEALAISRRLDPENVTGLLGRGVLALGRHDFAAALRLGREAHRLDPYEADAFGVIGDALVELGRYDEAFSSFQTMVDTKPELASYARVSYARELLGDVPGAIGAMRLAFDAAGSLSDAAWAAHQLGELEYNRGRIDAAQGWYERGLALDPEFVPNAAGLGKVAWARDDIDRATERYAEVVATYPTVEYVAALRDLYAAAGREDLAGQQDAVIAATQQLQMANGVNTDLEISLYEADHGDPSSALEAARAEWARRRSVHVADALAWALFANTKYEQASRYSERALALGTRNASFLFHAGMIERALGHDERALRFLRDALAVNPHFSILHAPIAERVVAELEAGR